MQKVGKVMLFKATSHWEDKSPIMHCNKKNEKHKSKMVEVRERDILT